MTANGRVLVVDDSYPVLELVRARLTTAGYDVLTAPSVTAARPMVRDRDLVIVDFHMPGIDGAGAVSLLRRMADQGGNSACRFYMYTSDNQKAATHRDFGFDGVFSMKGDMEALVRQMNAAMRILRVMQSRSVRTP